MFAPFIARSETLELIEEESSEESVLHKVTFRVLNLSAWSTLLVSILQSAEEEEDYVVSVRKEYFLQNGAPTYVWTLLVWGDYAAAAQDLGPLFEVPVLKARPLPTAPAPAHISPERPRAILSTRMGQGDDGQTRMVKVVRLPFRRGERDDPGNVTKKLGDRKRGAFVSTVHGE
jgi:hypothetical protein